MKKFEDLSFGAKKAIALELGFNYYNRDDDLKYLAENGITDITDRKQIRIEILKLSARKDDLISSKTNFTDDLETLNSDGSCDLAKQCEEILCFIESLLPKQLI